MIPSDRSYHYKPIPSDEPTSTKHPGQVEVVVHWECRCGRKVPEGKPCPTCGRRLLLD